MAAVTSKRKREDHEMPHMRAAPGMQAQTQDFDDSYLQGDDPDGSMNFADMLAQHNADTSGAVNDDQSHIQAQPHVEQGDQSTSDTAAAAMAQYHTMTVPPSTEQTFMQQVHDASDERQPSSAVADPVSAQPRTSSFGEYEASAAKETSKDSNGETDTSPTSANRSDLLGFNSSKPTVGSDEWHKVRRDNHKEGQCHFLMDNRPCH
jgi:transcriptional regulator CBF1